eukprot:s2201_g10.t7
MSMLGNQETYGLSAKAAESHGLLKFVVWLLEKYSDEFENLPEETSRPLAILKAATQAAYSMDDILKMEIRKLSRMQCQHLMQHYLRFLTLLHQATRECRRGSGYFEDGIGGQAGQGEVRVSGANPLQVGRESQGTSEDRDFEELGGHGSAAVPLVKGIRAALCLQVEDVYVDAEGEASCSNGGRAQDQMEAQPSVADASVRATIGSDVGPPEVGTSAMQRPEARQSDARATLRSGHPSRGLTQKLRRGAAQGHKALNLLTLVADYPAGHVTSSGWPGGATEHAAPCSELQPMRAADEAGTGRRSPCRLRRLWRKMLFGLCFFHALIQEICMMQLRMFLEENDSVPYAALRYTAAEANYGGRVTDVHDRRCINFLLTDFYCSDILKEDYNFSPSGVYYAPAYSASLEPYIEYIRSLPINQMPEAFGLHANANLVAAISEAATKYLEEVQPPFDTEASNAKYPVDYNESMNTVLNQELLRFNRLISKVRSTLRDVKKAVKGILAAESVWCMKAGQTSKDLMGKEEKRVNKREQNWFLRFSVSYKIFVSPPAMLPGGYMVIYPNRRVVVLQHAGPPLAVTQSRLARSQQPILPPTTAMGSEVQVPPAVRGPGSGATAPPGPTVSFVPFERRAPPEAGDDLFASPEASRFKLDPAAEMTARNWSPGHSQPDVARFDLDVTQRDWVRPGSSPRRTWNRPPVDEPSMVFPRWWTKRHSEEAFDSEWELLQSWFTQHHAGEGPCLYRMYQEALSAAPPKGRCHDHGWHAVAEYRLRQIEWVAGHMGLHPKGSNALRSN